MTLLLSTLVNGNSLTNATKGIYLPDSFELALIYFCTDYLTGKWSDSL